MKIVMTSSGTINSSLTYRILSLAKALVRKGHTVSIITPSLDKYSSFNKEEFNSIEGVNIIRPLQLGTKSIEINLVPYIISMIGIMWKINADIIHLYKPTPATVVGILPKYTKHIPIVADMDDLGSQVMEIENNSKLKVKLVEISEKLSLKNANSIVTASTYLQDLYKKAYPKTKITWIPNGVESHSITKARKDFKNDCKIVVVGSLNRNNIVEPLLRSLPELVKKYKNLNCTIIGEGSSVPYFKSLVEELGVKNNFVFTGWVPMNQLSDYISFGDIGYTFMPDEETTKACSNLKIFQYMAMGAVPLVSQVGDLPFYIDNGKAGYIANTDKNNLVKVLDEALADNKIRIAKAEYALKYVERFTWDKAANKLEEVYNSLLKV